MRQRGLTSHPFRKSDMVCNGRTNMGCCVSVLAKQKRCRMQLCLEGAITIDGSLNRSCRKVGSTWTCDCARMRFAYKKEPRNGASQKCQPHGNGRISRPHVNCLSLTVLQQAGAPVYLHSDSLCALQSCTGVVKCGIRRGKLTFRCRPARVDMSVRGNQVQNIRKRGESSTY